MTWEVSMTCNDITGRSQDEVANVGFTALVRLGQCWVDAAKFGMTNAVVIKDNHDLVLILTTNRESTHNNNRQRDIKHHVEKFGFAQCTLDAYVTITKIKFFTKVSQKRFGWGNADATREDVARAVHEEDHTELLTIMPGAAPLIQRSELASLPQIFTALENGGALALTDCVHELFTETAKSDRVVGPCSTCHQTQLQMTKCANCNSAWCKQCACLLLKDQTEQNTTLQAYHEVTQTHVWQQADKGGVHCDLCMTWHKDNVACACGSARCKKCAHVHKWVAANNKGCGGCQQMAVNECERGEAWCSQCCVVRGIDTTQMCMIPNNEPVVLSMVEHTER